MGKKKPATTFKPYRGRRLLPLVKRVRQVLTERGRTIGVLERESTGSVCMLGAFGVASVGDEAFDHGRGDAYEDHPLRDEFEALAMAAARAEGLERTPDSTFRLQYVTSVNDATVGRSREKANRWLDAMEREARRRDCIARQSAKAAA